MNKIANYYSQLAYNAMIVEVELTPKPGLVDLHSNGAHTDMSAKHFYASAKAIQPYLAQFIHFGCTTQHDDNEAILSAIRPLGLSCEQAMYRATQGINTHKGAIFALGLICVAIGRLAARQHAITVRAICEEVAYYCRGIVKRELQGNNLQYTAGQRLFTAYGLTGARGEAESGFATVLMYGLPSYWHSYHCYRSPERALHSALLHLMCHNQDTNVVARSGLAGLRWLQKESRIISSYLTDLTHYHEVLTQFDKACIQKNISPGGSADLLMITWLFAQIELFHEHKPS